MKIRLSRFKIDDKEFARMAQDEVFARATREAAETIKTVAIPLTPRSTDEGDHLQDSYEVESIEWDLDGRVTPRRAARVVLDARHALPVEKGTAKTKPHRMLTRAAGAYAAAHPGVSFTSPGYEVEGGLW